MYLAVFSVNGVSRRRCYVSSGKKVKNTRLRRFIFVRGMCTVVAKAPSTESKTGYENSRASNGRVQVPPGNASLLHHSVLYSGAQNKTVFEVSRWNKNIAAPRFPILKWNFAFGSICGSRRSFAYFCFLSKRTRAMNMLGSLWEAFRRSALLDLLGSLHCSFIKGALKISNTIILVRLDFLFFPFFRPGREICQNTAIVPAILSAVAVIKNG